MQVGAHYLADGWGQSLMTLAEFIDRHVVGGPAGGGSASDGGGGGGSGTGYLAQHELFDQIPAMRRDVQEPDFCRLGASGRAAANAWFGPPGTVGKLSGK